MAAWFFSSVPERVLLFRIASGAKWERAGIKGETATAMIVRGLIERDPANRLALTERPCARSADRPRRGLRTADKADGAEAMRGEGWMTLKSAINHSSAAAMLLAFATGANALTITCVGEPISSRAIGCNQSATSAFADSAVTTKDKEDCFFPHLEQVPA
jgi:hypothetical protein